MKLPFRILLLVLSTIMPVALAEGGIIFDQPHNPVHATGSDTIWFDPFNGNIWQLAADDFWFSQPSRVDRVVWRGFYGGDFYGSYDPPTGVETMRLRVYGARPQDGLPGDVIREQTTTDARRTPTGLVIGGHPEFEYEMTLEAPLSADANTAYWLEVAQVGDPSSVFRWVYSAHAGTPFVVTNGHVPDWVRIPDGPNLCFQLHGVPEPHGLLLFVTVLMACDRIGGRREARWDAARLFPSRRNIAAAPRRVSNRVI
ncbi:MAG: hypothetical protein HZA51_05405 [Planctomycetes bacterium]|nr:hypothetical protein [Planctomycetota bacterium]